jgi:hypothetical protein
MYQRPTKNALYLTSDITILQLLYMLVDCVQVQSDGKMICKELNNFSIKFNAAKSNTCRYNT